MLCNCFSAAKRTRDCRNTAFCNGKKRVNHALPRHQQGIRRFFHFIWSFSAYRPFLHQGQFNVFAFVIRQNTNGFFYRKLTDINFFDGTFDAIRNHNPTFYNRRFLYGTNDISCFYQFSRLSGRFEFPFFLSVQRRCLNPLVDIGTADLIHLFQRALDSVINGGNQSRSQFHTHGHPR